MKKQTQILYTSRTRWGIYYGDTLVKGNYDSWKDARKALESVYSYLLEKGRY